MNYLQWLASKNMFKTTKEILKEPFTLILIRFFIILIGGSSCITLVATLMPSMWIGFQIIFVLLDIGIGVFFMCSYICYMFETEF